MAARTIREEEIMNLSEAESVWLVRRILAREIWVEYVARHSLVVNYDLDISADTFGNREVGDLELVRMLREDQGLPKLGHTWIRDRVINICQELRFSHSETDEIVREILPNLS